MWLISSAYRDYVHPIQSSAGPHRLAIDQWWVVWCDWMEEPYQVLIRSQDDQLRIAEFLAQHDRLIAEG